jgi:beta-glucosidase
MVYVVSSYLIGANPPFLRDGNAAFAMSRHVLALHADAYRILKGLDPRPTVATIEVYLDPRPMDPDDAGQRDAAARFDAWYHGTLLDALATGWVRVPGREPEEIPHLRGALDLYGFNYYCSTAFGGDPRDTWSPRADPPRDALGRAVNPEGMETGLARVAAALPGVPILVTENGCPTGDEAFRCRYVAAHLAALDRARRRGAPVRGYFHWTAVDNYEWIFGFAPDVRFGLIGFDPRTGERHVKTSARWLAEVIRTGVLDPARVP